MDPSNTDNTDLAKTNDEATPSVVAQELPEVPLTKTEENLNVKAKNVNTFLKWSLQPFNYPS